MRAALHETLVKRVHDAGIQEDLEALHINEQAVVTPL